MNWNQLKYVLKVAEKKNISKAARELFISQPSLSISINQLEKEVGQPLFTRIGNTLELTYAGKMYCQWAEMVLYSQNQMQEKFNEINVGRRERIDLGISPHRSAVLTPVIVNSIHERFPDCELHIVEKPNNELTVLLAEDKLDMIINIPSPDNLTYENEVITDEEICLAIPRGMMDGISVYEMDGKKLVALQELKNHPFILLPEQSYFGKMSRQCLKEAGVVPNVICECTFSDTAKKLVESGAGVAFLPDILAVHETDEKKDCVDFFAIKNSRVQRTIAIVYKKEKYHSEQFIQIVQIFKECFLSAYRPYTRREIHGEK